MITFAEKRQEFLKNIKVKCRTDDNEEAPAFGSVSDDDTEADLMTLLERKFDELFGPLDDNS